MRCLFIASALGPTTVAAVYHSSCPCCQQRSKMASQCSLICMSVLVAISIQQQLTMDCDELVPSTSNYQSDWSDNTGNNADSSLSSCTYGTDVISSNCSNGTLHFFGWFSCVHESRFIPMVYWRTIINGTAKVSYSVGTTVLLF